MYTGNKMRCDPRGPNLESQKGIFINKEKITASSKYSGTSIQKRNMCINVTNLHVNRIPFTKCSHNGADQGWFLIKNIFYFCWYVTMCMVEGI